MKKMTSRSVSKSQPRQNWPTTCEGEADPQLQLPLHYRVSGNYWNKLVEEPLGTDLLSADHYLEDNDEVDLRYTVASAASRYNLGKYETDVLYLILSKMLCNCLVTRITYELAFTVAYTVYLTTSILGWERTDISWDDYK